MTSIQIRCDHCNAELRKDTSYPHAYALRLDVQDHRFNTSGSTYAIAMPPPLDGPKDFCNKRCLHAWLETQLNSAGTPPAK